MQLLLGCGTDKRRNIRLNNEENWTELFTVDIDENCKPDLVYDLNKIPLPFQDNSASEIHIYNVLEHLGTQGDYKFFFKQFEDFWRILKPDGLFAAMVPAWDSFWALGDPGHTRIIHAGTLSFLDQSAYEELGSTMRTDYRWCYQGNFKLQASHTDSNGTFYFVLQAIKS